MTNAQIKVLNAVIAAGAAGYAGGCREGRTLDILVRLGKIVHRAKNADAPLTIFAYFAVGQ